VIIVSSESSRLVNILLSVLCMLSELVFEWLSMAREMVFVVRLIRVNSIIGLVLIDGGVVSWEMLVQVR